MILLPCPTKTNQHGQSLVELLIGITFLTMVLVSVGLLATKSVQISQVSLNRQRAISLAKKLIEDKRRVRDEDETMWSEFAQNDVDTGSSPEKGATFSYTLTTAVEETRKLRVKAEVNWTDVKGAHTVTQETFLTKWD